MKSMIQRRGEITNQMIDKLKAYLVVSKPQPNTGATKQAASSKQAISHNSSDSEGPVAENDKAFQKLVKESIEQLER